MLCVTGAAFAQSPEIDTLRKELDAVKSEYQQKIQAVEKRLDDLARQAEENRQRSAAALEVAERNRAVVASEGRGT